MSKCPKCGVENRKPASAWTGGGNTRRPMRVQRFLCSSCGTSYVSWVDAKTGEVRTMTRNA